MSINDPINNSEIINRFCSICAFRRVGHCKYTFCDQSSLVMLISRKSGLLIRPALQANSFSYKITLISSNSVFWKITNDLNPSSGYRIHWLIYYTPYGGAARMMWQRIEIFTIEKLKWPLESFKTDLSVKFNM